MMKSKSRVGFQSIVILLLFILVVLMGVVLLNVMRERAPEPAQTVTEEERASGRIGYATTGVTIATDAESLQRAVDEAAEEADEGSVAVEYRVAAYSEDGVNFSCYIGNPADSPRDKFIVVFGDSEMSEELFVSGLIRPGEVFESIALNRKLEPGSHSLPVTFTDVKEVDGEQVITGQVNFVITFNVG